MSQIAELQKLCSLLRHIMSRYAADADALIDWPKREIVVTIDQGGKTIYAATMNLDSPALEAKARLIRHELEQMIADCELPILFAGEAA